MFRLNGREFISYASKRMFGDVRKTDDDDPDDDDDVPC